MRCASPPLSLIFSLVGLVRTRFAPRPDMARRERGANTERENFHATSLWRSRCEEGIPRKVQAAGESGQPLWWVWRAMGRFND